MIHAKNYESASTFVKVIGRKTVGSFFQTRCTQTLRLMHMTGAWTLISQERVTIRSSI